MISINEYLISALQKTSVFEMAYSKEKYVDTVCDLVEQMVQNIFLIMLANETGVSKETQNHWLSELDAHVYKLWQRSIMSSKEKALRQAFSREDLDDISMLQKMCKRKLEKEKQLKMTVYDVSFSIWKNVKEFIWNDLIEIICDRQCDTRDELCERLEIE